MAAGEAGIGWTHPAERVQAAYENGFFDDPENSELVHGGSDFTREMQAVAKRLEAGEEEP